MIPPPDSLKPIKPYLERGAELATRDPLVAYHCRLYALQEALSLRPSIPEADMSFIINLMEELEAERPKLGNLEDASIQVENFGQDLFKRADDADRAGHSDLKTAKAFLAAANVLECCKQFGELPPDLAEKIKYAKVRFVEIAKATKERRPPAPPREAEPLPGMNDDADEFPSSSLSSLPNVSQPDPGGNPGEGVAPPSYLSLPEAPVVQSPTTPSAPVFPPPPPSAGEWPDPTVAPPPLPPNALPTSPARMPVNMVMPTRHNTYKPTVAQMRDAMGR